MSTPTFRFGEKHKEYMRRALHAKINVAEGAVRAGKTVDHVYVFSHLLETSPDRIHLATGATASSAKITIGDCNGLGLEARFAGRCRWCLFHGCEALKVNTKTGEKIILFAGGKNADSYKKIRGNSYGMWIATEIDLHHDSMIKEAFNRQLAARDRRVFWDLNPASPSASIYKNYIDVYAEKAKKSEFADGFYNYGHFTIFDNPTVSKERLCEILSQYDKGSVWYRRDILGERCSAEGAVYPYFTEHLSEILIKRDALPSSDVEFITVGVDFGGNRSKTAFVACAFMRKGGGICIVGEHTVKGGKGEITGAKLNDDFAKFISSLRDHFPDVDVRYAFCDSESQYLINGLRSHVRGLGDPIKIGESAKRKIKDRIDCTTSLMVRGRFRVLDECVSVQKGLSEAVWDPDSEGDVRLDNFTSDIDILDAMEYSFERYMNRLV